MKKLTTALLIILLASCTTPKYGYAPAIISHHKGKIHIQPTEKFKPMPDTIIHGTIIKRIK